MSQAIEEMRLRRASYRTESFDAPWSLSCADGAFGLHVVERGRASLLAGEASLELDTGDLVILPRSARHTLRAPARTPRGERSQLVSGRLEFEADDHPVFGVLPSLIHVPHRRFDEGTRQRGYLRNLVNEALHPSEGSDALLARLTDVLLIEVMRCFAPPPGTECPVGGWFSGLADPGIRRALAGIHEQPAKAWTVATLARVAHESRSAFAARFAAVMREPPMAYLTRWRMYRARTLLRQTELSLEALAEQVGYGSAAALSLAFARAHGLSPGAYRRKHAVRKAG